MSKRLFAALRATGATFAWLLVLLLGTLFLGAGVHGWRQASVEFRPQMAVVIDARISARRGDATTSSRNSWTVSAGLQYRYGVAGTSYQGLGTIDVGRASSPSEAEALAALAREQYAEGRLIQIYVDELSPARSVLAQPSALTSIPVGALGLLFLAYGLGVAVLTLRRQWGRWRGQAELAPYSERATDRWLNRLAIVFLLVVGASVVIWMGQSRPTELLILSVPWVGVLAWWLRSRRKGQADTSPRP